MASEIVRFEPGLLPPVRRFVERTWRRPSDDAFYRWRYLDAPLMRGFLAMREGEVLATLWAFRRPWRVGDRVVHLQEVFDWFALPEMRRSGVGIRTLQAAMKEHDPCILVGGTEDSRALLPRLGWRHVGSCGRYLLPIRGVRLVPTLAARLHLPGPLARPAAEALTRTVFRPRRRPVRGGRVVAAAALGDEALALLENAKPWGAIPLWPAEHLRWLTCGHPSAGHFVPLYFAVGEELLGFALLRIYPSSTGCDAELIEIHARENDPELYRWMVAEVAATAAGFGAGLVGTTTACPTTRAALAANRFRCVEEVPVHLWSAPELELPEPWHVHSNTADSPLIPIVADWW